jgi:hypothetical protein
MAIVAFWLDATTLQPLTVLPVDYGLTLGDFVLNNMT